MNTIFKCNFTAIKVALLRGREQRNTVNGYTQLQTEQYKMKFKLYRGTKTEVKRIFIS